MLNVSNGTPSFFRIWITALEKPQAGNCLVPFMKSITLLPLMSPSMRLRVSSLMDPRFGYFTGYFTGSRSATVGDAGRQRERVNRAVHQLSEGRVHHLVLVDPRFAAELGRDDDRLKVVLRPGRVRDVDACSGKSIEKALADDLGLRHGSSGTNVSPAIVNAPPGVPPIPPGLGPRFCHRPQHPI